MMDGVPHLSPKDIENKLDDLYGRERKRHLVAFYGTGDVGTVDTQKAGRVEVVPVKSELDLREQLPDIGDSDRRMAFLIPWTGELPLDVAGRFALSGRILRIGTDARLASLFGVPAVDPDAVSSPLAKYLLAHQAGQPRLAVQGSRLTLSAMWSAWLRERWRAPTGDDLAADTLVGWAALDGHGAQFVEAMRAAPEVRAGLLAFVSERLGPVAKVALEAWEKADGKRVLEWAVLFETLAENDDAAVRMWVQQAVGAQFGVAGEDARADLAKALGAIADGAMRYVQRVGDRATVQQIIKNADAHVDAAVVRGALAGHNRLPSAWRQQLDALGALFLAGAADPTAERVSDIDWRRRKLEAHDAAADPSQTSVLSRAEMAVRLLAWLASKPADIAVAGHHDYADAEALGAWYADQGGYVDMARRRARGDGGDAFGAGVQAVVEAADAVRDALDARFAKALGAWVEAGRPSEQVLPIDQAVKRVAVRFLSGGEERRLLVLLLDGMAWAQAVEILEDLGGGQAPWGPLAWHTQKDNKIGAGAYPPMFANLPTVTEVSRAAFFAGKAMPPGKKPDTGDDAKRWRDNKDVQKLLPPTDPPRLLARAESHTGDGSASPEALSLVGDGERRIVAIIINAIDASLKGDSQQHHEWKVDSIRSLRALLERARQAGRAVLLASDHGHVAADRLQYKAPQSADGGARYRPWPSPQDPVQRFEVAVAGAGVFTLKDAHGVVMMADETSRYGSGATAGEHGGATLAEVVAPCLLIGCEDTVGVFSEDDAGQRVMPAYKPHWWHLDVGAPIAHDIAPPAAKKTAKKPKKNEQQLELLAMAAPAPAREGGLAGSALLASLVPDAKERSRVVSAVAYLVARNGVASGAAFAEAMGVLPYRIEGFVATLGDVLNVDGYQVVRYDHQSREVKLDHEKLATQFEVAL